MERPAVQFAAEGTGHAHVQMRETIVYHVRPDGSLAGIGSVSLSHVPDGALNGFNDELTAHMRQIVAGPGETKKSVSVYRFIHTGHKVPVAHGLVSGAFLRRTFESKAAPEHVDIVWSWVRTNPDTGDMRIIVVDITSVSSEKASDIPTVACCIRPDKGKVSFCVGFDTAGDFVTRTTHDPSVDKFPAATVVGHARIRSALATNANDSVVRPSASFAHHASYPLKKGREAFYPHKQLLESWMSELTTRTLADAIPSFSHTINALRSLEADLAAKRYITDPHSLPLVIAVLLPSWVHITSRNNDPRRCSIGALIESVSNAIRPMFPTSSSWIPKWAFPAMLGNSVSRDVPSDGTVPWEELTLDDAQYTLRGIYLNEWRTWLCDKVIPMWLDRVYSNVTSSDSNTGSATDGDGDGEGEGGGGVRPLGAALIQQQLRMLHQRVLFANQDSIGYRLLDAVMACKPGASVFPLIQRHVARDNPLSHRTLVKLATLHRIYDQTGIELSVLPTAKVTSVRRRIGGSALLAQLEERLTACGSTMPLVLRDDFLTKEDIAVAPACLRRMFEDLWSTDTIPMFSGRVMWPAALAAAHYAKMQRLHETRPDQYPNPPRRSEAIAQTILWVITYAETHTISSRDDALALSAMTDSLLGAMAGTPGSADRDPSSGPRDLVAASLPRPFRLDTLVFKHEKGTWTACPEIIAATLRQIQNTSPGMPAADTTRELYCPIAVERHNSGVDSRSSLPDVEDGLVQVQCASDVAERAVNAHIQTGIPPPSSDTVIIWKHGVRSRLGYCAKRMKHPGVTWAIACEESIAPSATGGDPIKYHQPC